MGPKWRRHEGPQRQWSAAVDRPHRARERDVHWDSLQEHRRRETGSGKATSADRKREKAKRTEPAFGLAYAGSLTLNRMPGSAPERIAVLPRAEASGSHHSRGPSRESYTVVSKSRPCSPETTHPAAAYPTMPAERMRAPFPPTPGARALLQPGVPAGGAEVVVLEGAAELSGDGHRKRKA